VTAPALAPLLRALDRRTFALDDWGARVTAGSVGWRRRVGDDRRGGEQALGHVRAVVHRDVPAGRGSATIDVDAGPSTPFAELVAEALDRAMSTIGPAWTSPPPAAPARVAVADPAIARPVDAADQLEQLVLDAAATHGASVRALDVEVVGETVSVATSRGLDASWPQTALTVRALLVRGDRHARVERSARRLSDLALDAAIAGALADADRIAAAAPTPAGRVRVALEAPALLHGGLGLFAAFVAQADPGLERQGLVAARAGRPIVDGATAAAEPLTLTSDGTLPFGLASTPIADVGDPVRRFALVERGLVRGLALDAREAALRGAQANGGVRGLLVPAGPTDADALLTDAGPVLLVEAWHWLALEPVTGELRARIALGRLHAAAGARDVRGGIVRADALAALALARRSRELASTPRYRGPRRWLLGELAVDGG
jgi:hypothetical protein